MKLKELLTVIPLNQTITLNDGTSSVSEIFKDRERIPNELLNTIVLSIHCDSQTLHIILDGSFSFTRDDDRIVFFN